MKKQRWMLCSSMVLFGTLGPFVRSIGVSSGELALYRAILAALIIGAVLLLTRQKLPLNKGKKEVLLLLLSGAAMGINWMLLFEAYKYTTVSTATLSYYFAPVIVMAVCPLLFREKLGLLQIVCFVMATVGLVLITGFGMKGGTDLIGIGFGLSAAVFYATVILLNKFIQNVAGLHRTFLQFISAIVVLLPYVAFTGGVTIFGLDTTGWVCLLIVGLIHSGLAYCLYFPSIKTLPGQTTALLSYIDPLVAVLLSVTVLGESMTALQAVGGALILGFTLFNEISPQKE